MPLLLSGKGFRRELEAAGCLAIHVPLEGGAETRILRRLRAAGYLTHIASARGLGDPEVFLTQLHGIRPPHLGHQSVGRNGALGEVQYGKDALLRRLYIRMPSFTRGPGPALPLGVSWNPGRLTASGHGPSPRIS